MLSSIGGVLVRKLYSQLYAVTLRKFYPEMENVVTYLGIILGKSRKRTRGEIKEHRITKYFLCHLSLEGTFWHILCYKMGKTLLSPNLH